MNTIRLILADDHALLRAGVRTLLQSMEGIEVVAEAADGREALERVDALRPQVLATDIGMPGLNGLELTARVTQSHPDTRVLVLSMHSAEHYVRQALRFGALGYLLKDSMPTELELAVRAVARGESYLTPAVSKHVVTNYVNGWSADAGPLERLTPRQRETLQLLAEGRSTKEIARTLTISIKTVETYRSQLMDRLAIHDFAGLVRFAVRMGLVQSEN
jgi:DNA-binding NarL/FixJ family response regulator